jgi:hypothetical protein
MDLKGRERRKEGLEGRTCRKDVKGGKKVGS